MSTAKKLRDCYSTVPGVFLSFSKTKSGYGQERDCRAMTGKFERFSRVFF